MEPRCAGDGCGAASRRASGRTSTRASAATEGHASAVARSDDRPSVRHACRTTPTGREAPFVLSESSYMRDRRLHRRCWRGRCCPARRRRRRAGAGRGRLEALHRVVRPRRDRRPDAAAPGTPAEHKPGPRQHRHPRAGARQRRGRRLPRVHRHDRARAAQARRQPVARRAEPLARAARPEGRGAARLQQHLRAGDARGAGAARSASRASPTCCEPTARGAARSACRTSSCSAPTAGRRCKAPTALRRRRRPGSTTASPTTRSPPAAST